MFYFYNYDKMSSVSKEKQAEKNKVFLYSTYLINNLQGVNELSVRQSLEYGKIIEQIYSFNNSSRTIVLNQYNIIAKMLEANKNYSFEDISFIFAYNKHISLSILYCFIENYLSIEEIIKLKEMTSFEVIGFLINILLSKENTEINIFSKLGEIIFDNRDTASKIGNTSATYPILINKLMNISFPNEKRLQTCTQFPEYIGISTGEVVDASYHNANWIGDHLRNGTLMNKDIFSLKFRKLLNNDIDVSSGLDFIKNSNKKGIAVPKISTLGHTKVSCDQWSEIYPKKMLGSAKVSEAKPLPHENYSNIKANWDKNIAGDQYMNFMHITNYMFVPNLFKSILNFSSVLTAKEANSLSIATLISNLPAMHDGNKKINTYTSDFSFMLGMLTDKNKSENNMVEYNNYKESRIVPIGVNNPGVLLNGLESYGFKNAIASGINQTNKFFGNDALQNYTYLYTSKSDTAAGQLQIPKSKYGVFLSEYDFLTSYSLFLKECDILTVPANKPLSVSFPEGIKEIYDSTWDKENTNMNNAIFTRHNAMINLGTLIKTVKQTDDDKTSQKLFYWVDKELSKYTNPNYDTQGHVDYSFMKSKIFSNDYIYKLFDLDIAKFEVTSVDTKSFQKIFTFFSDVVVPRRGLNTPSILESVEYNNTINKLWGDVLNDLVDEFITTEYSSSSSITSVDILLFMLILTKYIYLFYKNNSDSNKAELVAKTFNDKIFGKNSTKSIRFVMSTLVYSSKSQTGFLNSIVEYERKSSPGDKFEYKGEKYFKILSNLYNALRDIENNISIADYYGLNTALFNMYYDKNDVYYVEQNIERSNYDWMWTWQDLNKTGGLYIIDPDRCKIYSEKFYYQVGKQFRDFLRVYKKNAILTLEGDDLTKFISIYGH